VKAEDNHLVTGAGHGPSETVDVRGDSTDDERGILPRQL
jgi:hypothetical protein